MQGVGSELVLLDAQPMARDVWLVWRVVCWGSFGCSMRERVVEAGFDR